MTIVMGICKGCGKVARPGADPDLCEQKGSGPFYDGRTELETLDCSTLFTTWLLGQDDLAPKVLASSLLGAERLIAIDEWLMSK